MTRINSAISVTKLTDEHLLAEHREIKRLPYCLKKAVHSGSINDIPEKFSLGKGHVTFFLDKQGFIQKRYKEINLELKRRGFEPTDFGNNWADIPKQFNNMYNPTREEKYILTERIKERISESNKKVWHYHRKPITKEDAIKILTN